MIAATPDVTAEWPDARIVLVDDESAIRLMLRRMLTAHGYTAVREFGDPDDALAAMAQDGADLLVLDLHMPRVDGIAVLEMMRDTVEPSAWPATLMMTGAGTTDHAHQALALGAADFLRKPVGATELLLRVRHQLRERRLRLDLERHTQQLEDLVDARAGELALLSRVLDDMPVAAVVFDPDLRVRYANARAQEFLAGRGLREVIDLFASDELPRARLDEFLGGLVVGTVDRLRARLPATADRPERRVEIAAQRLSEGVLVALVHDIEEQELATEVLHRSLEAERVANDEMRAAEQLRTNFLSAVSHELRTPLTVVLGLAESLQRHDPQLDEEQRQALLERLHANGRRLGRLLDDLLDLNRLASGHRATSPSAIDLAAIVRDAVDEVDGEHHDVRVEVVPTPVVADAVQIRRAVANVIRNAVVHTPPGTRIEVSTASVNGVAHIRVADHGPGVPDPLKTRIFAPFEQGPVVPSHQPGTGIGLSLVAEFVGAHGGRAWVEDTPGGGATFVLEVPRDAVPSEPATPTRAPARSDVS